MQRSSVACLPVMILMLACADAHREPLDGTLRIYLARHGQTDWNAERRLQGGTDTELNETGRRQARELAERLASLALDHVYSSQLQRSRETAEIAAGDAPLASLAELNEQSLGIFEGKYLDGRDPKVVEEFRRRLADPDDALDGGESTNQHFARVASAVETIRGRHASGQILIVGHGLTNIHVLRALLDLTPEQADKIRQANDELYMIELPPDGEPGLWKYIPPSNLGEL